MARKTKKLSADDLELWKKVANSTRKLDASDLMSMAEYSAEIVTSSPEKRQNSPAVPVKIQTFRLGEQASQRLSTHYPEQPQKLATNLDKRVYSSLKKGKLKPEARIDLHGMTAAQAQNSVVNFILNAAASNYRLVLVITGKGKRREENTVIPERSGTLRSLLPYWLHSPSLRPYILDFSESHVKHGGQGAYYVYLKRKKSV